jgi:hypothetical protein
MKPNRSEAYFALLACAISVLLLSGSHKALAQKYTPLPDNDRYSVLAHIQAMHQGEYSRSGPSIKVFEVGGGDPAMNGSFIYIRIDHNDRSFVWKTGLNVRSVKKMSFATGHSILLLVDEDIFDTNAAIRSRAQSYTIQFHLDNDELQNTMTIGESAGVLNTQ